LNAWQNRAHAAGEQRHQRRPSNLLEFIKAHPLVSTRPADLTFREPLLTKRLLIRLISSSFSLRLRHKIAGATLAAMLGAHSGTLAAAAMMMTVSTVSAFTAPMALRSFQSAGARSSLVSRGALKDFLPAQPRGRARVGGSQTTAVMAQER
jgi:hypothetical protein